MKKRIVLLTVACMCTLAACVPAAKEPTAGSSDIAANVSSTVQTDDVSEEKTYIMGAEQFPAALDPANEWDGWFTVRYGIGETLFRLNENLDVEPWLADSFESIDENTWAITLKDGIKFSNGNDLTPEMVVKNFEKIAELNSRAAYLKEAEYTVDGNKIIIKTKEPRASFINDLTDPYAAIIDLSADGDIKTSPVGTGPYMCVEFVADTSATMVPNTDYWNGTPKMSKVVIKKILDKETGAMALGNGELDAFVELNPQSYQTFLENDAYTAASIPTSRVYAAYFNTETMSDVNLRKAIHLAIDKESIGQYLLNGAMTATESPFIDSTAYGSSKLATEKFDLDAARELLKESGYEDTDGNGFLEKDGKELNIDIKYYSRLSLEAIATEVQAALAKLGINATVTKSDNSDYLKSGDFDMGFYTVVTTPTGDPQSYLETTMREGGVTNFCKYHSKEADALLDDLNKETDSLKRAEIAVKLGQLLYDSYSVEYIGFNNLNVVTKKNVIGYYPHPSDYYQITVDLDKN